MSSVRYRSANRQALRTQARDYYKVNAKAIKEKQRLWRAKLKLEVLMAYGGCRCSLCLESRPGALVIDHVGGGGNAHRRMVGSGNVVYRWLKKNGFPAGFRVLCANCNHSTISRFNASDHPRAKESRNRYYRIRLRLIEKLGNKCEICGVPNPEILSVHHRDGDGGHHRELRGLTTAVYADAVSGKYPIERLSCLCHSCHAVHHYG